MWHPSLLLESCQKSRIEYGWRGSFLHGGCEEDSGESGRRYPASLHGGHELPENCSKSTGLWSFLWAVCVSWFPSWFSSSSWFQPSPLFHFHKQVCVGTFVHLCVCMCVCLWYAFNRGFTTPRYITSHAATPVPFLLLAASIK
jgi:hypothetical protein